MTIEQRVAKVERDFRESLFYLFGIVCGALVVGPLDTTFGGAMIIAGILLIGYFILYVVRLWRLAGGLES